MLHIPTSSLAMLLLAAATVYNSHLPPKIQVAGMTETGARAPATNSMKDQARAWVIIQH